MKLQLPLNPGVKRLRNAPTHLDLISNRGSSLHRKARETGLAGVEPATQAAILTLAQKLSKRVFFDVGAHVGMYSALVSSTYRDVACFAFEPTPRTAKLGMKLRNANNLTYPYFQVAASDRQGTTTLHISTRGESSNSLNPDFRPGGERVEIRTERLDDLWRGGLPAPGLMKIDVETHEPAVLEGGVDMIAKARPWIVCEVLPAVSVDALGAQLTRLRDRSGYRFYPVTRAPVWEEAPVETVLDSRKGAGDGRDWLLAPKPLTQAFFSRLAGWNAAVAACGPDTTVFADDAA